MLALLLVAAGGYAVLGRTVPVAVSQAHRCDQKAARLAALFSDDETTLIRISNPDLSDLRVLRTEPAAQLPGMFDSLVALSVDSSKLAYITAGNELMDDAHIWSIDVAHPEQRQEVARVATGLWPERPSWSPDKQKVAFVTVTETDAATGSRSFHLMTSDLAQPLPNARVASDLSPSDFTNGRSTTICWGSNGVPGLIDSTGRALVPASGQPTAAASGVPEAAPSPTAGPLGTPCGVPVFSQNDPAWRHLVMQAGGDLIGGYGCAVTATTMMLDYFGANLTPAQLSSCLGAYADPLFWSRAPTCTNGVASGGSLVPFSWPELDSILARGDPAIVGLIRGQTGSHFVVVTGGFGQLSSGYTITDPWDGTVTKTLGAYVNTGYNLGWIVTFGGQQRHCNRAVASGVVLDLPHLLGVTDGGTYNNPVHLGGGGGVQVIHPSATPTAAPSGSQKTKFNIIELAPSVISQLLQPQPQPSPSPVPIPVNFKIPFQPLPPDQTISKEGIYIISAVTPQLNGPPLVDFMKFTVDMTPPTVNVSLLNAGFSAALSSGNRALAATRPRVKKLATFQIASHDNLSGVVQVQWSYDHGPFVDYFNNTNSSPRITFSQLGDHTLSTRAGDAAGNMSAVTDYDFTVYDDAPAATPTPTETPTSSGTRATPTPTHTPTPPPAFSVTPSSLLWKAGTDVFPFAKTITVRNTGTVPFTAGTPALTMSSSGAFTLTNGCTAALGPGATCTITVNFHPGSYVPPTPTGTLTVPVPGAASQTVSLTGFPG